MIDKEKYHKIHGFQWNFSVKNNDTLLSHKVYLFESLQKNSPFIEIDYLEDSEFIQPKNMVIRSLVKKPVKMNRIVVTVISDSKITYETIAFDLIEYYFRQSFSQTGDFTRGEKENEFTFDYDEHHCKHRGDEHHTEENWKIVPKSFEINGTSDFIFIVPPKTTFNFYVESYYWENKARPKKVIFSAKIELKAGVPHTIDLTKEQILDYDVLSVNELQPLLEQKKSEENFEECKKIQDAIDKKNLKS